MIPIRRGDEPDALRTVRYWRRARVLWYALSKQDYKPTDAELDGYGADGVVKKTLLEAQGPVCAYCEMHARDGQVEHFRPKAIYFWLTWSYDNLFVSCGPCNGPEQKGSKFELLDGSKRLQPGEKPQGQEKPKLLDPSDPTLNPVDCIQFINLKGRWQPVGRELNERGDATIKAFGLDQGWIVDLYERHIDDMKVRIDQVREAMANGNVDLVRARWQALIGNAFHRTQRFKGLSYDYLAHVFPKEEREKWAIELRKPGEGLPEDPLLRDRENPAHAELDATRKLQICALGRHPSADERDNAIVKLCEDRAWTAAEVAEIFEYAEDTAKQHLRRLVGANRLELDGERYRAVQ